MGETRTIIDLSERGDVPAHTYAFYRLRDLQPGEAREVLFDEDPTRLLEWLSEQLRHGLAWQPLEQGPPVWRMLLLHRDAVPAASLVDLLERDHLRLDRLFALAMRRLDAGDLAAARDAVAEFERLLHRHLHVENEMLARAFVAPRDPQGTDPTSIMLREHEQILEQVGLIQASFTEPADAQEIAPLFALLSGQLAKHEAREELNLFPNWAIALNQAPPGSEQALMARVRAILEGEEDQRLGLSA